MENTTGTPTSMENFFQWASNQNFVHLDTAERVWHTMFSNATDNLNISEKFTSHETINLLPPENLGVITGLFLALFIRKNIIREFFEQHKVDVIKRLKEFLCFMVTVALMPLLLLVTVYFKINKCLVGMKLEKKYQKNYKGFLDGPDVVWACERDITRSVINILAFLSIDSTCYSPGRSSSKLLYSLRERVNNNLRNNVDAAKMFYKRKQEMGYFFWTDENPCRVEKYIRHMDLQVDCNEFITEEQLKTYICDICNTELPENHSRTWEMLVSKQPMRSENNKTYFYPVVFRVSHTLGDGVALLRLLLEGIADKSAPAKTMWSRNAHSIDQEDESLVMSALKTLTTENLLKLYKSIKMTLGIIYEAPYILHQNTVARTPDSNLMHPTQLNGQKVLNWIHEQDLDFPIMESIKIIKNKLPGTRFSDVIITALTKSIRRYFTSHNMPVPDNITLAIPTRMKRESHQLNLRNGFSVAMETVPIKISQPLYDNQLIQFFEHMQDVKTCSDTLYSSHEYQINYWLMSFVAGLSPDYFFAKLMESSHSTIAFSNLPGPLDKVLIQGYKLERICFFLPNFGLTSVGITVISYGNKLHLGIMADKNSISSKEDAGEILKEMVNEIQSVRNLCAK